MSHEIVKRIKVEGKSRITITSAPNNISPLCYEDLEFCKPTESFEDALVQIFKYALNGEFELRSTCGQFYQIYKYLEDVNLAHFQSKLKSYPDLDWKYKTDFYKKKVNILSELGKDIYRKRTPRDNSESAAAMYVADY